MKKATKQAKRYRILRADGLWWSNAGCGWDTGIQNASRMTKREAKEVILTDIAARGTEPCALVEVGTKPSKRQLFKSMFNDCLTKLAKTYGLNVLPTTHDTFYIGGFD